MEPFQRQIGESEQKVTSIIGKIPPAYFPNLQIRIGICSGENLSTRQVFTALIILMSSSDHVWRQRRSLDELVQLLEYLLPPPN